MTNTIISQDAKILQGNRGKVNCIAFSNDSKTLVSGDENGNLIFFDTENGKKSYSLETESNITSINFSPAKESLLVFTYYEGEINIMDAVSHDIKNNFSVNGNVYYALFSPNGKQLAVAYTKDPTEQQESKGIRLNFIVSIFETGKYTITKTLRLSKEGDDDGELFGSKLFETYRYNTFSCDFNPDGTYLAAGTMGKGIGIYSFALKSFAPQYKGHSGRVTFVTFSPDGNYLASTSKDNDVKIWEVRSAGKILTLKGHEGTVNSASFSPASKFLATASNDETVKIWDVNTSKLIKTLSGFGGEVYTVKFSPDSNYLAASGSGEKILVWKTTDILPPK
ncbi:MAG: WD40 repeat domain-containing protein [Ignavibacteria bacterium]|nr:WD40 repeat domain-containing protein [Ignavibacteria bacterium]